MTEVAKPLEGDVPSNAYKNQLGYLPGYVEEVTSYARRIRQEGTLSKKNVAELGRLIARTLAEGALRWPRN